MKVFVVIEEFYGTVTDVNAYRREPKDLKEWKKEKKKAKDVMY